MYGDLDTVIIVLDILLLKSSFLLFFKLKNINN
jgi:hypothetical protein